MSIDRRTFVLSTCAALALIPVPALAAVTRIDVAADGKVFARVNASGTYAFCSSLTRTCGTATPDENGLFLGTVAAPAIEFVSLGMGKADKHYLLIVDKLGQQNVGIVTRPVLETATVSDGPDFAERSMVAFRKLAQDRVKRAIIDVLQSNAVGATGMAVVCLVAVGTGVTAGTCVSQGASLTAGIAIGILAGLAEASDLSKEDKGVWKKMAQGAGLALVLGASASTVAEKFVKKLSAVLKSVEIGASYFDDDVARGVSIIGSASGKFAVLVDAK